MLFISNAVNQQCCLFVPTGLCAKKIEIMHIEQGKLCVKMSNYALHYALI